jgi:hypothetical protein
MGAVAPDAVDLLIGAVGEVGMKSLVHHFGEGGGGEVEVVIGHGSVRVSLSGIRD